MAPRIVSWSDNEICTSPVLSNATSIVPFDSTFSDTYPSHSQLSPTASEAPGLHCTDLAAKRTGLHGLSEEGKTPRGGHAIPDDSFIRHDVYSFKDGNVTFLIGGTLYCIHRYFFSRDSVYFSTRFAQLDIRDHEALPTIISIGDVERNDFEALLSILYPKNFEAHELSYEQWKSVLHLSTRWGFASLRQLALKSIKPPTPHDQFVLARTYSVDHWVLPALSALCERTTPLNLDEARQMSMEDVVLVATVREEIRGGALQVDAADIPRHVEIAQAGTLNRPMGNDANWDVPKSGTTGKDSDPTTAPAVDPNVKTEVSKKKKKTKKTVKVEMIEVARPPGDKPAGPVPVSSNAESTRAQETAPTEVVSDSKPSKALYPAPSATPSNASLPSPAPPSPVPADATPAPPIPEKDPAFENVSTVTVTKEAILTSDLAASASPKTDGKLGAPNAPDARETLAQTEAFPATVQGGHVKPDEAATEPTFRPSQDSEAGGGEPHHRGDDCEPRPAEPPLRLDHIREVGTAYTSSPGMPANEAASGYDEARVVLVKPKKNKMRAKERKRLLAQARKNEESTPHPPSEASANEVVPEPVATGPVGKGEGDLIQAKLAEKPDATATTPETAADDENWW